MKGSITIICILLSLVISQFTVAQNGNLKFNLVKGNDGRLLGKINSITQDKYGYMWFGSSAGGGILRYDGNRMVSFKHDTVNNNSLGMTSVEKIITDDAGMIWIGGNGGLDQYNSATGNFKHFRNDKKDPGSLVDNDITAILKDHHGRLWVGTNKGLDRLDEKTGKFIHYHNESGNPKSLSNDVVNIIYEDRKGVIWVGTGWRWHGYDIGKGGLNRLETDGSFTRFLNDPKNPHSLINNKVNAIFEDSRGVFWIGTNGFGLNIMDRETGSFERLPFNTKIGDTLRGLPYDADRINSPITFILEDSTGAIWIGTRGYGINRFDTATKTFTHYQSSYGYPDVTGWCAYTSRDGVLWIDTEEANLYRADPSIKLINNIAIGPVGMVASAFLEEKNGTYWVGSDGAGLLHYDQNNKLIHQYNSEISNALGNPLTSISSLFQSQGDSIWLGMYKGGILIFNTRTQKFSRFKYDISMTDSLPNPINSFFQDREGYLWIGRWSGLTRYNPLDGTIKKFLHDKNDPGSIMTERVSCAIEDRNGDIWVGGFYDKNDSYYPGLSRLNKKSGRFSHYLKRHDINNIYEDSDGTIWVVCNEGLYGLKKGDDVFKLFFDVKSELADDRIQGLVEDNQKYLWISMASAIVKISPDRKIMYAYGSKNGIQPNNVSSAISKFHSGRIFVGNVQGFYHFSPEELVVKTPDFKINITDFFINNLPLKQEKGSPLQHPIEEITGLVLNHDQNNFGFSFAGVDYKDPEDNKYFTMLENYDSVWREAKGDKSAFYFYVQPGDYVFHVKGKNSDGTEGLKEIKIRVLPPWWKTWWAYSLYGLLLVSALFVVDRIQKQRIIQKEREKAQVVELAQAKEIEKAYHELRSTQTMLIQSEKMASLGELTAGIAHEIQNPLNFVNNFSDLNQDLIRELNEEIDKGNTREVKLIAENLKDNEAKINYHGRRADSIVKGMLQHSRTSTGQKESADINVLADEYLRLAYHGLRAKDKSFNAILNTEFDPGIGKINVILQDIGRVMLNLYNNAFYAVSEKKKIAGTGYEPAVTVSTRKLGDKIEIVVVDNGIGIPQQVRDKIFQPFFTTKPTGQGTGLGLSLSYDIVKAHGGNFRVESRENEFTRFIIELPI